MCWTPALHASAEHSTTRKMRDLEAWARSEKRASSTFGSSAHTKSAPRFSTLQPAGSDTYLSLHTLVDPGLDPTAKPSVVSSVLVQNPIWYTCTSRHGCRAAGIRRYRPGAFMTDMDTTTHGSRETPRARQHPEHVAWHAVCLFRWGRRAAGIRRWEVHAATRSQAGVWDSTGGTWGNTGRAKTIPPATRPSML